MNMMKRSLAFVLLLALLVSLAAMVPVEAKAEENNDDRQYELITKTTGFYCLHPHKETPTDLDAIPFYAESSEDYTEYSPEVLNYVAATILLTEQYKEETGIIVDGNDIQYVIWSFVCDKQRGGVNEHLTSSYPEERVRRIDYHNYVRSHASEVQGKYQMTIWVSTDPRYQDILEAKRIDKNTNPSVEKKVMDCNDSDNNADAATGWQDSADYDIGDSIPFQITAKLKNVSGYQTYYVEFVDQMEHLTFQPATLHVHIDGVDKTDAFSVTWDETGKKLNIECQDVLILGARSGSEIVVTYNATLDADANIGRRGNPNEVYLVYSYNNGKSMTPKDKVVVFTYQLTVKKTDEDNNPLSGAAFELIKVLSDGTFKSLGVQGAKLVNDKYVITDPQNSTFLWQGIDEGKYLLKEVISPDGYTAIEPLPIEFTVVHEKSSENPEIKEMYSSKGEVFDGWRQYFDIFGDLDFEIPDGTVLPPYIDGYWYSEEETSFDELRTYIVNKAGVVLPSTGGIGTTIFYVIGSILVVGAGILLVTKKRMSMKYEDKEEK